MAQTDSFLGNVGDVVDFEFEDANGNTFHCLHTISPDPNEMVVYDRHNRRKVFASIHFARQNLKNTAEHVAIYQRRPLGPQGKTELFAVCGF